MGLGRPQSEQLANIFLGILRIHFFCEYLILCIRTQVSELIKNKRQGVYAIFIFVRTSAIAVSVFRNINVFEYLNSSYNYYLIQYLRVIILDERTIAKIENSYMYHVD